MHKLYAPWRTQYARTIAAKPKRDDAPAHECVFCTQFTESNDHEHGILRRFKYCVVMLNKYPYNAGHVMILPLQHTGTLYTLTKHARQEMMELASYAQQIVTTELDAHGVNLGINFGKAAGAGIPSHLHMHILPRFEGDTNFMPTLCDTKQISVDLSTIYAKLKPAFDAIEI